MQHLLALVISFKLGGAFDYRRSSWANVLWPLWGVAGFTGVLLSLLLCCGVPMLVRRHASGSGTHVQLMVLLVLVLLCATYLPAVVSAVRSLAAWLDGEPDISAASILAPYLVACSIVLLTLARMFARAFTPASLRTIAVSAPEAEEAEEGSGVAHLFSTLPAPYALVRESSTLLPPCVGRAARTIQAIAKGRRARRCSRRRRRRRKRRARRHRCSSRRRRGRLPRGERRYMDAEEGRRVTEEEEGPEEQATGRAARSRRGAASLAAERGDAESRTAPSSSSPPLPPPPPLPSSSVGAAGGGTPRSPSAPRTSGVG